MTDLEMATNELVNALDLIKGSKAFDRNLIIEAALQKYAISEVKKLNIPAVSNLVCLDWYYCTVRDRYEMCEPEKECKHKNRQTCY